MEKIAERPPTGRREARKQQRREAIVAIAAHSFLEHGYAGTSMSAIAAELGGSKGTLWSYFPSKEELFGAVIEERANAYQRDLESLLDAKRDLKTTLASFCRGLIEMLTSPDALALHRLIAGESGRFPEVGRIFHERAPAMTTPRIEAFLAEHMARGNLRQVPPDMAAGALIGLCLPPQQRAMWGLPTPDPERIDLEARFVADAFLRAFDP